MNAIDALAYRYPDVLLPEQTDQSAAPATRELGAHQHLWRALLLDGVYCFRAYVRARDARRHGLFIQAKTWIFERPNRIPASTRRHLTFVEVCAGVGVDPDVLREQLERFLRSQQKRRRGKLRNVARLSHCTLGA